MLAQSIIDNALLILKRAPKGFRSKKDIEFLRNNFIKQLSGSFGSFTENDFDYLLNNIDYIEYGSRSLIFLQGDVGKDCFVIVSGDVDLYVESSRTKAKTFAVSYGDLRSKQMPLEYVELPFGRCFKTLMPGTLFGELAILSDTANFRSCTAVTGANKATILLYIDEGTFNAVPVSYTHLTLPTIYSV